MPAVPNTMGVGKMSEWWVERAANESAGMRYARDGIRGQYSMWFEYEGRAYVYAKGPFIASPTFVVSDKKIRDYARTLWELGK